VPANDCGKKANNEESVINSGLGIDTMITRQNASQYPTHQINGKPGKGFLDLVPLHAESYLVRRDEQNGKVVAVIARLRSLESSHCAPVRPLEKGELRFGFRHNGETGDYAARRLRLKDRDLASQVAGEANAMLAGRMDTFFRVLASHEVSTHGTSNNRTNRFIRHKETVHEKGGI